MYNERYKFYGMHQEDFYHNPGGARRPIPHQKDYCHDDYMYLVKVDKDDPTPNYLGYKISGTDGIIIEQLVDNHDGTKTLLIKNKGGENGNYSAGEFITIDNDNRIIGVSGLEDVYLTKEEASGIYAPKGCIDRINAEAADIIQSAKSAWNPMYDTFTSYSGDWQKAALGNNYYEGPYISIYSGEDERQYISASGLTTQEDFENVSSDLYGLSGYIHNSLHPEVIGISSYVYNMWENCSGIPTKISGQIDTLISSYSEFSANIEERVSQVEWDIPVISGDGTKIIVNSYSSEDLHRTVYTISSTEKGGVEYKAGEGIQFKEKDNAFTINTSGVVYQNDFNVYSSKIDKDTNYISGYSNEVSSYIHDNEEQWLKGGNTYSAGDGIEIKSKGEYFEISTSGLDLSAGKGIKVTEYPTYIEIATSGMMYNEDFAPYSSKVAQDINSISSYASGVSAYIKKNEEEWKKGNTYSAGNLIDISTDKYINVISGEDGVALSGDVTKIKNEINGTITNVSSTLNNKIEGLSGEFKSYSADRTLTDTILNNSASSLKNDINKVSSYASEVSAYIDENKDKWLKDTTYSAGNLINISKDNYINVISGENGVALSGDVKNLIQGINGTISNVSSNLNTKIEGLSGEFQAYSADRTLTDTILNNSASSLKSDINKVSSYANDVSAYINTHQAEWSARTLYSAGEGIQFNPKGDYIEIATSGLDFSAGKGIKINEYDTYIEIETSGLLYSDDFNTYSSKVAQDINDISSYGLGLSAYISGHESIWEKGNNYEISSNNTNLISAWKVEGEDGYTFNISANPDMGGGTTYSAGDWIDSEKLNDKDNPTISISGYKPLFVEDPLYFDVDDEKTTLKIDQQKIGIKEKVTLIANGYRNENDNVITTSGITATIPNSYTGVWNFKFDRPMVVNICINARFMPDTERYEDYYDTVGFKVTESTNPIYFTLHGYAPQHFNASTITTIPEGAEIPFSFYLGDNERESIVTGVEQPCITIQEI